MTTAASPSSPSKSIVRRGLPLLRASRTAAVGRIRRQLERLSGSGRRAAFLLLAISVIVAIALTIFPRVAPWSVRPELLVRSDNEELSTQPRDRLAAHREFSTPAATPEGLPWGRRIIRRANLEVELPDVERGISRLTEVIEAAGGYVAETQTHTDTAGTLQATITVYVPPDQFTRAIADLAGLGRVTSRRISGQDVSEEFVDLEARVRNLERHEAQLMSFMSRAQKVADLLSLENELARVRGEIERLTGRARFLKARTEMATIQIGLTRTPAGTPSDGIGRLLEEIRIAFRDGWFAAFRVAASMLVLAAQASPLAIPVVAAWGVYRRWIRRRPAASPPATASAG